MGAILSQSTTECKWEDTVGNQGFEITLDTRSFLSHLHAFWKQTGGGLQSQDQGPELYKDSYRNAYRYTGKQQKQKQQKKPCILW